MNSIDLDLIAKNDLFCDIDFESVKYMLEHSILRTLKIGERLIEPDSQNQHLHLILEGSLNVHLLEKESQQYTVLGAGECVGGISVVDGKYPSALVIAAEHHCASCPFLSIRSGRCSTTRTGWQVIFWAFLSAACAMTTRPLSIRQSGKSYSNSRLTSMR